MKTRNIDWYRLEENTPDEGITVLVYCRALDDVVFGYLGSDGEFPEREEMVWLDAQNGSRILEPEWWSDIPYPEDQ